MKLRKVLEPPRLDPEVVRHLIDLADGMRDAAEIGSDPTALLSEFNERTDQRNGVQSFKRLYGEDLRQFVRSSLMHPPYVPDMTRAELVEIIRRACPQSEEWSEDTEFWYGRLFERHVPMPGAWMLLYHPPDDFPEDQEWDPTMEQVVDLALAYQPIITPFRPR